ncbi:hypothetical protein H4R19_002800 [Coemansia spiralis]|nr:hypothetical protein H4R19_002800 [Coemansia spiralis]
MLGQVRDRLSLTGVSVAILCVSALYALLRGQPGDSDRCRALESTGWWVEGADLAWQPQGCTMRQYSRTDVRRCFQAASGSDEGQQGSAPYALFIGDSAIRNKFHAFARTVDPQFGKKQQKAVHADIEFAWPADFEDTGLAAKFVWDPYLDSATTRQVLAGAYNATVRQPRLLVIGTGLWFLRNQKTSGGTMGWRRAIDRMAQQIHRSQRAQAPPIAEHIIVSPVSPVVPSKLNAERRETLRPELIQWMNSYMEAAQLSVLGVWSAMAEMQPGESSDGLHYSDKLEAQAANVLLNRVCNKRVLAGATPPFRTTCCFAYPRPARFVVWSAAATALVAALALAVGRGRAGVLERVLPGPETLRQMAAFGAVLLVMFVCDRTPLLDKLQKHFVPWVFWLLAAASLVVGGATWGEDAAKAGGFLGRAQTDEWKGWMQLAILVYHLMNASGVAAIYNPVRVLVAMYLFMTGYGHCMFFCLKGDFGLTRLTAVLLRTNILAVALAYVMGTSYMDYYFAPLSSAWVLIVWLTMRVRPDTNTTPLVWAKIAASAATIVLANHAHLWPFGLLARLGVKWSAREWEFRFGTDIFIVYVGMATAVVFLQHGAQLLAHPRWPQIHRWSILASVLGLAWYFWFEVTRESKFAYNRWHPYIAIVPTLAFVVLRNATPWLRARSSRAFRFVGLISLELFIAQFHLFLAADTKGILVLVHPRLWFVNLAVTSLVFVAMCRVLGTATAAISTWLMAPLAASRPVPDIPMTELPRSATTLDRLAPARPTAAVARIADNLAVRWAVGLLVLLVLNNHYG